MAAFSCICTICGGHAAAALNVCVREISSVCVLQTGCPFKRRCGMNQEDAPCVCLHHIGVCVPLVSGSCAVYVIPC